MSDRSATAPVNWSVDDDGVATVSMRSADGRNALTNPFVDALTTALKDAADDPSSRVLLLTGLPDIFCSGAAKELLVQLADGDFSPSELYLPRVLLGTRLPLIAAMEGHGVGGGFAVGLCADVVLLARESRYGCNFMELGITPGMGTTRLLEQALTPTVARELLLTGELRRGSAFEGIGGFNYILPKQDVLPKALDVARRIAEKPRFALETLKASIAARRLAIFEEAFEVEAAMHNAVFGNAETRQRIEAEFVE